MGKRGVIRQVLASWRRQAIQPATPASSPAAPARLETLEARQLLSAAVDPVVSITWHGQKMSVLQNRYVVEFQPGAKIHKLALESQFSDVRSLGGGGYYSLRAPKTIAQMETWAANRPGAVVAVAPDVVTRPANVSLPNDPFFGDQWQYDNTGQLVPDPQFDPGGLSAWQFNPSHLPETGTPDADIDATDAWSIVRGDPNAGDPNKQIVVAVFDSGIDLTHPDLVNNIWTNTREIPGNNFDDDGDGYVDDVHGYDFYQGDADPTDDFGHGTHVSGIIGAAGNNNIGVTGVIQNVKILPVRVFGANSTVANGAISSFIQGIQYVTTLKNQGVNIVAGNASLGFTQYFGAFPFNRILNDAVGHLSDAGVLLVVAAGNDGFSLDPAQTFPGKFSLNQPNVITVAATDDHDNIAFFSNIGTSVQIAAPGVNILSTLPTYDVNTLAQTGQVVASTSPAYGYESGTSMASPMVAGALALMKAAKPDASMTELKTALLTGTDYLSALNKPNSAGSPLVSTAGRLNVNKAILNLLNQRTNVDKATRGSWVGAYGKQGAVLYGATGSLTEYTNSFVTARVSGASLNVFSQTSKDPDALQGQFNHNNRVAAQLTSAGPITLDLEFTDGRSHRVSLYQAALNSNATSQVLTLVDPDSGATLASYDTGNLATGQYQTFEVNPPAGSSGPYRLRIVVTPAGGHNAVLNGLFFDPATTGDAARFTPSSLGGVNPIHGGNWRLNYGSQGAKIFGSAPTLNKKVTVRGATQVNLPQLGNSPAALVQTRADSEGKRYAGYLQSKKSSINIRVNVGASPRKLTLYAADLDRQGRAERVDLYDANTGALLDSADLTHFVKGKYLSWVVSGKVRIHVTKLAGPNAVVGGIFLDAAPGAPIEYVGMDNTSSGNWKTYYGADASFVFGSETAPVLKDNYSSQLNYGYSSANLPSGQTIPAVTLKVTNGSNGTPHRVVTGDARFPLSPGDVAIQHLDNPKATGNAMNLDLKFTDQRTHTVAVYMVDPDKNNSRAQRVDLQLINPQTGQAYTVASQVVSSFANGKYLVFNVTQTNPSVAADVRIHVTRLSGPTAVVNGVFIG